MKDGQIIGVVAGIVVVGLCVGGYVATHVGNKPSDMTDTSVAPVQPVAGSAGPRNTTAPTTQVEVDAAQQRAATEAAKQKEAEKLRRQEEERAKLVGSVRGAAWLVRNNGSSDLLRGLHVYIIGRKVGGTEVGKVLQGQIDYEMKAATQDREQAKMLAGYADTAKPYRVSAVKHDDNVTNLRKQIAQLPDSMETLAAYQFCAKAAPMMNFAACALSAKLMEGKSDIDGKYSIPKIPGGSYYLFADINTNVLSATWLIPISVEGSETSIDLDNDSAIHISGG